MGDTRLPVIASDCEAALEAAGTVGPLGEILGFKLDFKPRVLWRRGANSHLQKAQMLRSDGLSLANRKSTCKDPLMAADASAKTCVEPEKPPVPALMNPGAFRKGTTWQVPLKMPVPFSTWNVPVDFPCARRCRILGWHQSMTQNTVRAAVLPPSQGRSSRSI